MKNTQVSFGRYRYLAALTAVSTFVLLIAGALVTSTGSGLSVPDWPLSFGTWNPPMVGGIAYEHSHRMIATAIGVLTVVLTIWVCVAESRRWVRTLAVWSLWAVVLQGILGGMTVLHQLPKPLSIAHGCLGPTFFCMLVALTLATSGAWRRPLDADVIRQASDAPDEMRRLARLAVMTSGAVYVQLVLGAMMRHTGSIHALLTHLVWALVVAVHVVLVLLKVYRRLDRFQPLLGAASWTAMLVGAQIVLGVGAYLTRWAGHGASHQWIMLVSTVGHAVFGALILAGTVVSAMWASRAAGEAGGAREAGGAVAMGSDVASRRGGAGRAR